MPFKKGQSGNIEGRPSGSVNRTTAKAKKVFEGLLYDNIDQLREDIQSLTPERRVSALLKLAEFVVPKPNTGLDLSLEYKELERLLKKTPTEFIERLEEKLIYLHTKNTENE
ncbi:MAG: hypothetical protein EOM23_09920 [Candidatus Moranbacteria bacterium]|nr:hypothetical protein [Candidatus Moranbacteria bacterium]